MIGVYTYGRWHTRLPPSVPSPGELHPEAHTKPDVNLSIHLASIFQSKVECRLATNRAGSDHAVRAVPTNILRRLSDLSTACIFASSNGRARR